MKKSFLALSVFALTLYSCGGDTSGGNKGIVHVDENNAESQSTQKAPTSEFQKSLTWTAFKTPAKVGVKGSFSDITLTNTKEGKTVEESLEGAKFSIDVTKVATGDASRDEKLKTFFFLSLAKPGITGSFGKFEQGKVLVNLTMNGKEVSKTFTYSVSGNELTLTGKIDIVSDFGAEASLKKLNEACFELHEGKTWSDVELEAKISK